MTDYGIMKAIIERYDTDEGMRMRKDYEDVPEDVRQYVREVFDQMMAVDDTISIDLRNSCAKVDQMINQLQRVYSNGMRPDGVPPDFPDIQDPSLNDCIYRIKGEIDYLSEYIGDLLLRMEEVSDGIRDA